jgi:hypothetical protein
MGDTVIIKKDSIGTVTVLFLIFLVLKLTGFIDWSWWWVTSPIWISAGIVLIVVAVAVLILGIVGLVSALRAKDE